jgi:hypothetical protein
MDGQLAAIIDPPNLQRRGGILHKTTRELVPLSGYGVEVEAGVADTVWDVLCNRYRRKHTVSPTNTIVSAGADAADAADAMVTSAPLTVSRWLVGGVHVLWVVAATLMGMLNADLIPVPFDAVACVVAMVLACPLLVYRITTMRLSIARKLLGTFQMYFFWGTSTFAVVSHVLSHGAALHPSGVVCTLGVMLVLHTCIAFSDAFLAHRQVYVKAYYVSALGWSVASIVMASRIPEDVTFMVWTFPWSAVQSALDGNATVIFFMANAIYVLIRDADACVFMSAPYTMVTTDLRGRRSSEVVVAMSGGIPDCSCTTVMIVSTATIKYNPLHTIVYMLSSHKKLHYLITYLAKTVTLVGFSWVIGTILLMCVIFNIVAYWYTVIIIITLMTPQVVCLWMYMNVSMLILLMHHVEIIFIQLKGLYGYIAFMYMLEWDIRCVALFPAFMSFCSLFYIDAMHHSLRAKIQKTVLLPCLLSIILMIFATQATFQKMFTIGVVEYTTSQVAFDVFKTLGIITLKTAVKTWRHPSRYSTIPAKLYRINIT